MQMAFANLLKSHSPLSRHLIYYFNTPAVDFNEKRMMIIHKGESAFIIFVGLILTYIKGCERNTLFIQINP